MIVAPLVIVTLGGVVLSVFASDPATEAVRDLTEPHAVAAASVTFVLALLPLWLSAAYVAYRARAKPPRHNVRVIGLIVASGFVSLTFLGPKRSSGEASYERNIAEHGGSVANAIAMAGSAAAFVAVAVLPVCIVTAIVFRRRAKEPSNERFGQVVVSVLVVLALTVLALVLTSGELTAPLVPEPRS